MGTVITVIKRHYFFSSSSGPCAEGRGFLYNLLAEGALGPEGSFSHWLCLYKRFLHTGDCNVRAFVLNERA